MIRVELETMGDVRQAKAIVHVMEDAAKRSRGIMDSRGEIGAKIVVDAFKRAIEVAERP